MGSATLTLRWTEACRVEAFATRAIVTARVLGRELVVVRNGERFHAADRACPHEGADLASGRCSEGKIFCPRHDAWFDLDRGGAVSPGWLFGGLRTYPTRLLEGVVWVGLTVD